MRRLGDRTPLVSPAGIKVRPALATKKAWSAAAAAITDNDAWKAQRPGQMKIPREGLVAAIKSIIE